MEYSTPIKRGKNFRLLTGEELPLLLEFLGKYLPESLQFHQTVLIYIKKKVWEFYFYVADGWPEIPICLHFPGTTLFPHSSVYQSFSVFCPTANRDKLHLLREEDVLVDWHKSLDILLVKYEIAEELVHLYEYTGTAEQLFYMDIWTCEKPRNIRQVEDKLNADELNVQLKPLRPEHAKEIHSLYPGYETDCYEVFLRLIEISEAVGVFVDGKLAAWILHSYYGALFSMYTKPEFRRKGYGMELARYLTKTVAAEGYIPHVLILPKNTASQNLYKQLGYKKLYPMIYHVKFIPYKGDG